MFKSIVLILAALTVLQGQLSLGSVELQDQFIVKVTGMQMNYWNVVSEKARSSVEAICPGYGNKLDNVTMAVQECFESIDYKNETLCSALNGNFEKCAQPLTQLFEECLPERSRRVPSMLIKMILASVKYLCKINGEHLFELKKTCIKEPTIQLKRCVQKIETTRWKYVRSNLYPSAEEICEFFEELKPCLISHLQISCRHPITREAFADFMEESIFSVCNNSYMNEIELVEPQIS